MICSLQSHPDDNRLAISVLRCLRQHKSPRFTRLPGPPDSAECDEADIRGTCSLPRLAQHAPADFIAAWRGDGALTVHFRARRVASIACACVSVAPRAGGWGALFSPAVTAELHKTCGLSSGCSAQRLSSTRTRGLAEWYITESVMGALVAVDLQL